MLTLLHYLPSRNRCEFLPRKAFVSKALLTPSLNLCETREGHESYEGSYETLDITIASSLYGVLPAFFR